MAAIDPEQTDATAPHSGPSLPKLTRQHGLACGINAMNDKDVLCQIDANSDNDRHGISLTTN
jgi:hypothetical protein